MKSISPVIATVIIVAVAIAISIAVALWLTGIVGGFTAVENLQITYAYPNTTNEGWDIILRVENKGTGTATIDQIFVNGIPLPIGTNATTNVTNSLPVNAGESVTIKVSLSKSAYQSGQQVEIKLHTASGKEYPKMVTLP